MGGGGLQKKDDAGPKNRPGRGRSGGAGHALEPSKKISLEKKDCSSSKNSSSSNSSKKISLQNKNEQGIGWERYPKKKYIRAFG